MDNLSGERVTVVAATYAAPVAQTSADIVITWSSNEPTAGVTQTIANGSVPTVAELGQYVANINAQHAKVVDEIASLREQLVALAADVASIRSLANA